MVIEEKILTRQLIIKWYDRSRIDYSDLYARQYIAYNAWFRRVTQCHEDHDAIKQVMKRFIIWDDYVHGRTLLALRPIVEKISAITYRKPVDTNNTKWDGVVHDVFDWRGLIYYWYQMRCDLFHGQTCPGNKYQDIKIQLAYESLSIFMGEIVKRMRYCFTDDDFTRLNEVRILLQSENDTTSELKKIESKLYKKFIHSPDIWNVDMERV